MNKSNKIKSKTLHLNVKLFILKEMLETNRYCKTNNTGSLLVA